MIHSSLTLPHEFQNSIGRDNEGDTISLSVVRRAHVHRVRTTLRINIPLTCNELEFTPRFAGAHQEKTIIEGYRSYTWTLPTEELAKISFPLEIAIKRSSH
jgi:hypothetical protein